MKSRYWLLALALCILGLHAESGRAADSEPTFTLQIDSQPLRSALSEFGRQSGLQVVFIQTDVDAQIMTGTLAGSFSAHEALERLLANTSLGYEFLNPRTVAIRAKGEEKREEAIATGIRRMGNADEMRLAQAPALGGRGETTDQSGASNAEEESQEAPDSEQQSKRIDEVVVTAQKREERLRDVPISASVLSGAYLDSSTSGSLMGELSRVPGVAVIGNTQGGGMEVSIRGAVVSYPLFTGSSVTAYYLDSAPFGSARSSRSPDANVYDLERVEILRGPQGTLYGANALSGVVRVLTKDANLSAFEGKARTSWSNTDGGRDNYRGDVAVNVPLIKEKLALRAAVSYQGWSGWIDRPNKENANDSNIRNVRLKLGAQPTENLSVKASFWNYRSDESNPPLGNPDAKTNPSLIEVPVSDDYTIGNLTVGYDFPLFSLTSMTTTLDYHNDGRLDVSTIAPTLAGVVLNSVFDSEIFAQEFLLNSTHEGPWRWSLGGFYRDSKDTASQLRYTGNFVPASGYTQPTSWRDNSESKAVFGELTRAFLDGRFEVTAGLRYFEDEVEMITDTLLTGAAVPGPVSEKFSATTPRLVLNWRPSRDTTIYTSYSEGFRSGVLQQPLIVLAAPDLAAAKPDSLKNYEIGAKTDFWDGKVYLDGALYYTDWQDTQQSIGVELAPNVATVGTVNAVSASGVGAEAAIGFKPTDRLDLGLTFGWNDLTVDEDLVTFQGGANQTLIGKGERLINSPEYTAGASADYDFPVGGDGLKGRLSLAADYVSERFSYTAVVGGPPTVASVPSRVNGRASVSLSAPDDHWTTTVYAENITNNDKTTGVVQFATVNYAQLPRPRTIGVQLEYRFD